MSIKTNAQLILIGTLIAAIVTAIFAVYGESNPKELLLMSHEDGPIENVTALLCGLSCVGFLIMAARSPHLKKQKSMWKALFVIGWALLMFVFMGEEISWGQRLFGFETPETIALQNTQEEFNLHNLAVIESSKYRLLSVFMLITGVLLPCFALWDKGRQLIQKYNFPVMPIAYMAFFILSYIFGKYYFAVLLRDTATEVRELLMAIGMFAFGLHAALRPDDLFRLTKAKAKPE